MTMLTMDTLRAGRIECECRDGRDDDDQGPAVPGQLEGRKGQDVRSHPCHVPGLESHACLLLWHPPTRLLTACSGRPIAVHFLTLPDKVRSLALPAPAPPANRAQNHMPEYYEVTKLPMALDTIEVCSHISHVACQIHYAH